MITTSTLAAPRPSAPASASASPRDRRRERAAARRRAATGVGLTEHAVLRRRERGFSEDDVMLAVAHPTMTYPSPPRYGAGRRIFVRGSIAVVVSERTGAVVTVLHAGAAAGSPWSR